MSDAFTDLIAHLREQADLVLFDAPPMLETPDVSILANKLDATILTVIQGGTTREELKRTAQAFEEYESGTLLGVIFGHVSLPTHLGQYETGLFGHRRDARFRVSTGLVRRVLRGLGLVQHQAELPADDPERWIPLAEAAGRLGISTATARRWGKTGRLPTIRRAPWPLRYICQGDLEAIIAQEIQTQRERSAQPPPKALPQEPQVQVQSDQHAEAAQLSYAKAFDTLGTSPGARGTPGQGSPEIEPAQVPEETGEKP